jgi:hypothetical protein
MKQNLNRIKKPLSREDLRNQVTPLNERTALLAVIRALMNELQSAVDYGKVSSKVLEGAIWADTSDKRFAVNIEVIWEETPINIKATAFELEPHPNGIGVLRGFEKIPFLDLCAEEP